MGDSEAEQQRLLKLWKECDSADEIDYTNIKIDEEAEAYGVSSQYEVKCADIKELFPVIELLYLAGRNRSSRQNLNDLWAGDGSGVEVFRQTMTLQ
ncbi:hypothetical protein ILUMI_01142 [Ignelater luminosus]|uniref:Uncharacterized protein n=1 Tax=Ignelater luminosus TaxID=2038154 RepID=A0A8K0DEW6_IGNLU|nr:hypothetical protein ILUMI_01142 [Ignelater luminosus]